MKCPGSNLVSSVSDYSVMWRTAECPTCHQKIKITIPDRKMHGNTAKFSVHALKDSK